MSDIRSRRPLRGAALALLGILIVASVAGFMNRQLVSDFVAASQYDPTPEMQAVIDRIELTSSGDRIFRATHPTLNANDEFNQQCNDVEHSESDLILGCYTGENIHLFRITDTRLDGIVEVTAAHEMLHAAFDRLSEQERSKLSKQLLAEFERLSSQSPSLRERMSVYEHLAPSSFANELHSVLGTEVAKLSPALEQHYGSVLHNRQRIIELFNAYNVRFVKIEERRSSLTAQLETLSGEITNDRDSYEAAVEGFNADSADLSARNSRYEFSDNPSQFYALRDSLSARRFALEDARSRLNAKIDEYNRLRDELIAIDATAQDLIRSIDSQAAPKP